MHLVNGLIYTGKRRMIRLDELRQRKDSSSGNLSVYKRGKVDGSSVKTNLLA